MLASQGKNPRSELARSAMASKSTDLSRLSGAEHTDRPAGSLGPKRVPVIVGGVFHRPLQRLAQERDPHGQLQQLAPVGGVPRRDVTHLVADDERQRLGIAGLAADLEQVAVDHHTLRRPLLQDSA
jgi:hypothetical protein